MIVATAPYSRSVNLCYRLKDCCVEFGWLPCLNQSKLWDFGIKKKLKPQEEHRIVEKEAFVRAPADAAIS